MHGSGNVKKIKKMKVHIFGENAMHVNVRLSVCTPYGTQWWER